MPRNPLDTMSLDIATSTRPEGSVWTPRMPGPNQMATRIRQLEAQHVRMQRRGPRKIDTTSGKAVVVHGGTPRQVISCAATESPLAQVDRVYSQVAVSFTRDPHDTLFQGVHIWATGYHSNSQPVLVADSADSPCVFTLETTNEIVTLTVQSYGIGKVPAPFAGAPTTRVILNGQTTAPPAPAISSQTATITSGGITVGQQFAFAYLPASLTDVLDGYWLYKTNVHTPPGISARWKFVKASVQNSGVYTCVDSSGVSTNFYYVSSVNKQGLESSLSDATPASGGTTTTYRPSAHSILSGSGAANPANVWDGNASTFSSLSASSSGGAGADSWNFSGSISGSPTSVKLKVTSQVVYPTGASGGAVQMAYSTDGGSTYTTVYSTAANRAQQTDVITLANGVTLANVRVKMTIGNGTSATAHYYNLYEVWLEATT